MQSKLIRLFLVSAGILLLFTATAKLVSSFGSARILQNPDPILSIAFQKVFWIVGLVEVVVGLFCLLGRRTGLQSGLVAWLATNFLFYRLGLIWVGYQKPCSCLGNLTDAIHISPKAGDIAMKIVLGYLLVGSYATLIWLRKQRAGAASPQLADVDGSVA